jgi:uncharacterized protein (UPF0335 family)
MTNSDLRQRAQEIARLHDVAEEAKQILAEAYDAAASDGYSKPALRKAVKIYRMEPDKRAKFDGEQTDIEQYLAEIERGELLEAAE